MSVTNYDRQQSQRKGYNPYALAQYIGAVDECIEKIKFGMAVGRVDIADALSTCFNDRLLARLVSDLQIALAAGELV